MAASNLTQRVLTAVVMVPAMLALLFRGPAWGWLSFLVLAMLVSVHELYGMTYPGDRVAVVVGALLSGATLGSLWLFQAQPLLLLTVVMMLPFASICLALWRLDGVEKAALRVAIGSFGTLWIGLGLGSAALLRVRGGADGPAWVVITLGLAWLGDTGGYFAGRAFGKHKLYEAVSPKKTVEGAVGGIASTVLGILLLGHLLLPKVPWLHLTVLAVMGAVAGILGDLGESLLKRSVGVKDSGGIVPGHGGILDRIDAVLITAPMTLCYLLWLQ